MLYNAMWKLTKEDRIQCKTKSITCLVQNVYWKSIRKTFWEIEHCIVVSYNRKCHFSYATRGSCRYVKVEIIIVELYRCECEHAKLLFVHSNDLVPHSIMNLDHEALKSANCSIAPKYFLSLLPLRFNPPQSSICRWYFSIIPPKYLIVIDP